MGSVSVSRSDSRTSRFDRWQAKLQSWRYAATGARDERLDLLRGWCVAVLLIDHIAGPSPLFWLTGGSSFYVTAAEGFVCISGLLFGIVYRKVFETGGFEAAVKKAARRAFTIYVVMLVITAVRGAGLLVAGLPTAPARDLPGFLVFMGRVATMQVFFPVTRILTMYSVLIVTAPLAMLLLHRGRTALLLVISTALYLVYQVDPIRFGWPFPEDAYFHPYSFQILFVATMTLGYHRAALSRVLDDRRRLWLLAAAAASTALLVALYVSHGAVIPHSLLADPGPLLGKLFHYYHLRPGRVVAAASVLPLWFAAATWFWSPVRRGLGSLLFPLGRSSLYCYAMHIPFTVVSDALGPYWKGSGAGTQLLNAAAQLTVLGSVWLLAKYRGSFGFLARVP